MSTSMVDRFNSILISILLVACMKEPPPTPAISGVLIENEEQKVYAVALRTLYSARGYVIMAESATDLTGVENTARILDQVMENMPGVDPKTAEDFLILNSTTQPIASDMNLGIPYNLLTITDRSLIFSQNRDGWQVFYTMYPDAPGITNLSKPSFNATFTQALVYIGTLSNWHSGEGYFLLLRSENETWIVDKQVMTWIS